MGPRWVLWRLLYAVKLKGGVLQHKTPITRWDDVSAPEIKGRFFNKITPSTDSISVADKIRSGRFRYFFRQSFSLDFPPPWFANPYENESGKAGNPSTIHWSKISDFDQGDIKILWELSRFAWIYPILSAFEATRKEIYSECFWHLVTDWAENNPPNRGIHWKCGQEIAVRLFAIVTVFFYFYRKSAIPLERLRLLRRILYASATRIEANIEYAINQKNNHGICEAAGLFTAGLLFNRKAWIDRGRSYLESQAEELIYPDGSFSQHSTNYHRVMLQAFLWSIRIGQANGIGFSAHLTSKVRQAGQWLLALLDLDSGRVPNLGANDGALILPVSECDYLDYRPTIQAVGAVVDGKRWLPAGKWDDLADWLVPELPHQPEPASEIKHSNTNVCIQGNKDFQLFRDGGHCVLRSKKARLYFRCPEHFRHRPSQCDLLHVDLWCDGKNILRDSGTYSYNCPQALQEYFTSTAAHNTVQFDGHEQMPKISRFLYGKWPDLELKFRAPDGRVAAEFIDWQRCIHRREVKRAEDGFQIIDIVSGFTHMAVLRWHLSPDLNWRLEGQTCRGGKIELRIEVPDGRSSICLTTGWESLYYMEKREIPVLEVAVGPGCEKLITHICLMS